MAVTFTRNYRDHSNETGYQFEFFCDKCGNGYRSAFSTSSLGLAASLFKAAGSFFGGGALSSVGQGAEHIKDAMRGPAWDSAYQAAIVEIMPKFHQCTRCGNWVCPESCWNEKRNLCEACAPDLHEEAASAQAHAAVEQVNTKARAVDQTEGLDLSTPQIANCPHCDAHLAPNAKFCGECGTPVAAKKAFCAECGGELQAGAKFCPGCGKPAPRG